MPVRDVQNINRLARRLGRCGRLWRLGAQVLTFVDLDHWRSSTRILRSVSVLVNDIELTVHTKL